MQINSLNESTATQSPFRVIQTDLTSGFDKVISDAIQRGAGNDFIDRLFKNRERFVELTEMASQQQPVDSKRFLKALVMKTVKYSKRAMVWLILSMTAISIE